jgi:hypothetical protein
MEAGSFRGGPSRTGNFESHRSRMFRYADAVSVLSINQASEPMTACSGALRIMAKTASTPRVRAHRERARPREGAGADASRVEGQAAVQRRARRRHEDPRGIGYRWPVKVQNVPAITSLRGSSTNRRMPTYGP